MFIKKWTPVEMVWRDAHGGDKGWEGPQKTLTRHEPEVMRSVGYLLRDDTVGVTIVFSRAKDKRTVGEDLFVAAPMVVSVRPLS